jgi:hypothetical protein
MTTPSITCPGWCKQSDPPFHGDMDVFCSSRASRLAHRRTHECMVMNDKFSGRIGGVYLRLKTGDLRLCI